MPPADEPLVTTDLLAALDADTLRAALGDALARVDDDARVAIAAALVDHAIESRAGWTPPATPHDLLERLDAFVEHALDIVEVSSVDVDAFLRQGSCAFVRREYDTARHIFDALLPALSRCEIQIGERDDVGSEMGVEPLGTVMRYAVTVYLHTPQPERPAAVWETFRGCRSVALPRHPLRDLAAAALDPLPELRTFAIGWHAHFGRLQDACSAGRPEGKWWWPGTHQQWMQEAAELVDDPAALARPSRPRLSVVH